MSARRNVFAAFGWFVWKLLELVGLPIARRKIDERRRSDRRGSLARRLRRR